MFETDDWRTGLICADDERRLLNQTDTFLGWEAISPNPDALKYIIVDTEPGSTNVNILSKSQTIYEFNIESVEFDWKKITISNGQACKDSGKQRYCESLLRPQETSYYVLRGDQLFEIPRDTSNGDFEILYQDYYGSHKYHIVNPITAPIQKIEFCSDYVSSKTGYIDSIYLILANGQIYKGQFFFKDVLYQYSDPLNLELVEDLINVGESGNNNCIYYYKTHAVTIPCKDKHLPCSQYQDIYYNINTQANDSYTHMKAVLIHGPRYVFSNFVKQTTSGDVFFSDLKATNLPNQRIIDMLQFEDILILLYSDQVAILYYNPSSYLSLKLIPFAESLKNKFYSIMCVGEFIYLYSENEQTEIQFFRRNNSYFSVDTSKLQSDDPQDEYFEYTIKGIKDGQVLPINFKLYPKGYSSNTPKTDPAPQPTADPTQQPTADPTQQPTADPTQQPTADPTPQSTTDPTPQPTANPTPQPTPVPTDDDYDENQTTLSNLIQFFNTIFAIILIL